MFDRAVKRSIDTTGKSRISQNVRWSARNGDNVFREHRETLSEEAIENAKIWFKDN